jgi:hypothetical protein
MLAELNRWLPTGFEIIQVELVIAFTWTRIDGIAKLLQGAAALKSFVTLAVGGSENGSLIRLAVRIVLTGRGHESIDRFFIFYEVLANLD